MIDISEIHEKWQRLRNENIGAEGLLALRVLPDSMQDLFLAITGPDSNAVMFLEISSDIALCISDYPRLKEIQIYQDKIDNFRTRIILELKAPEYEAVFAALICDIINAIVGETSEKEAHKSLIRRLLIWQTLLARFSPGGLSASEQQGLYGELWFLREYCFPKLSHADALQAWTGPFRAQQDYNFLHCLVEVKTIEEDEEKILITGEHQLESSEGKDLLLYCLTVSISSDVGESLPGIINNIRQQLSENSESIGFFNELLMLAGYLDSQSEQYENPVFLIKREQFFSVENTFPRITSQNLLPGVYSVKYNIKIKSFLPYIIAINEANKRMRFT